MIRDRRTCGESDECKIDDLLAEEGAAAENYQMPERLPAHVEATRANLGRATVVSVRLSSENKPKCSMPPHRREPPRLHARPDLGRRPSTRRTLRRNRQRAARTPGTPRLPIHHLTAHRRSRSGRCLDRQRDAHIQRQGEVSVAFACARLRSRSLLDLSDDVPGAGAPLG